MFRFSVLHIFSSMKDCSYSSCYLFFSHFVCRYLLEEEADDSILLTLVIRIMDALVNYGNGHGIWMSYVI